MLLGPALYPDTSIALRAVLERGTTAEIGAHIAETLRSALSVGVMDEQHQARSGTSGGPPEHPEVAVRVAEGRQGPQADQLLDAQRLAALVIDEADPRIAASPCGVPCRGGQVTTCDRTSYWEGERRSRV